MGLIDSVVDLAKAGASYVEANINKMTRRINMSIGGIGIAFIVAAVAHSMYLNSKESGD